MSISKAGRGWRCRVATYSVPWPSKVPGVQFGLGMATLFEDDDWVDVAFTDGTEGSLRRSRRR